MPRPKPSKAAQSFTYKWHKLSPAAERKLLELLGLDASEPRDRFQTSVNPATGLEESNPTRITRLLASVENALGLYVNGRKNLDNIPRPVHYLQVFRPIRRQALKLHQTLVDLGDYYLTQLRELNGDASAIEHSLFSLAQIAGSIVKKYEKQSSKGAPKNLALTETTRRLRSLFREHYRGETMGRIVRGGVESLGTKERQEIAFVKAALRDAKIVPAKFTDQQLRRLFLDPRCELPGDRVSMVDLISGGASRLGISSEEANLQMERALRREKARSRRQPKKTK
jgi:hypothetical protein